MCWVPACMSRNRRCDGARAQRHRARRRVGEIGHLVARPGDVGQREPDQRVLPHGERCPGVERGADVAPRFAHERPGRAVLAFGLGVLLVKGVAARQRAAAADAGPHLGRELVEHAAADAGRPPGVAQDGEADDAERVQAAAAPRRLGGGDVRERLGHEHVVDAVVDAAGRAQPQHVPVVDQRGLRHREHEDPRFARVRHHAQGVDVARVLDSRREAPGSREAEPPGHRRRRARPRALTRDHRQPLVPEQLRHGLVTQIRPASPGRERRGHQHPAGRRVAVGHRLEDLQRRQRRQLGAAAQRAGHPHPQQPFAVERLHHRRRQPPFPVAGLRALAGDGRHRLGPFQHAVQYLRNLNRGPTRPAHGPGNGAY